MFQIKGREATCSISHKVGDFVIFQLHYIEPLIKIAKDRLEV